MVLVTIKTPKFGICSVCKNQGSIFYVVHKIHKKLLGIFPQEIVEEVTLER